MAEQIGNSSASIVRTVNVSVQQLKSEIREDFARHEHKCDEIFHRRVNTTASTGHGSIHKANTHSAAAAAVRALQSTVKTAAATGNYVLPTRAVATFMPKSQVSNRQSLPTSCVGNRSDKNSARMLPNKLATHSPQESLDDDDDDDEETQQPKRSSSPIARHVPTEPPSSSETMIIESSSSSSDSDSDSDDDDSNRVDLRFLKLF